MKKFLAALAVSAALVVGGASVSTAPAQAASVYVHVGPDHHHHHHYWRHHHHWRGHYWRGHHWRGYYWRNRYWRERYWCWHHHHRHYCYR